MLQVGDQSAYDDDGEGPLRIGSDGMGHGRREQTKRSHEHGHHDRPSRRVAASMAASTIEYPLARNWLIYSTITTPIWTETPNKARNPTPEETLK